MYEILWKQCKEWHNEFQLCWMLPAILKSIHLSSQEKSDEHGKKQFCTQKSFPYRIMGFALIAATQKRDLELIIRRSMKISMQCLLGVKIANKIQGISRKALKNRGKSREKKEKIKKTLGVQLRISYLWKDTAELGKVERMVTRVIKYKESFPTSQRVDNGWDGPSVWAQNSCSHLP